jgi:DNA mismatch repair ATPase MutS
VALVEFRSRQTVGLAAIDLASSHLTLTQFADNHLYTNTLATLGRYEPVAILMSDTAADTALYRLVRAEVRKATT